MDKYHITLTREEQGLLRKIDLRDHHASHDEGHAAYKANREPILSLVKSLSDRGAIPEPRRRYWTDPAYNTGRLQASHKGVFERNGCRGSEIYTHPHFLSFLRYFLFGAALPPQVISSFEEKVGNPQWVTSSDVVPIGQHARHLTRHFRLERSQAAEEFFKLCLDMGLSLSTAVSVRRSVMQAR